MALVGLFCKTSAYQQQLNHFFRPKSRTFLGITYYCQTILTAESLPHITHIFHIYYILIFITENKQSNNKHTYITGPCDIENTAFYLILMKSIFLFRTPSQFSYSTFFFVFSYFLMIGPWWLISKTRSLIKGW